jgi:glycosyltransferase involved in cell wall biosynthesis
VIIATKNRGKSIADISLPSLLRQDLADFEVLIWDASDDEKTKEITEMARSVFEKRNIDLVYVRALRMGSASQRNDAVKCAKGDIVFFMDDDSEVSSDGLNVLARYFNDFKWLYGLGLPIIDIKPRIDKYVAHPFVGALRNAVYSFLMGSDSGYRKVHNSTRNNFCVPDLPGIAEWLTGAGMAFRKEVFKELEFDERLELFGGYALGEDYDFSHRVFLRYGTPLLIAQAGSVVHHNVIGGRIADDIKRCAAMFYNTAIIRMNFRKYRRYRLLPFLWELRIKMILRMSIVTLMQKKSPLDICRGYIEYGKALSADDKCKLRED